MASYIASVTVVTAVSVERLGLKPCWLLEISLFLSKNCVSCLDAIFSRTFDKIDRSKIGLNLPKLSTSPFFKIGTTPCFQSLGKTPVRERKGKKGRGRERMGEEGKERERKGKKGRRR